MGHGKPVRGGGNGAARRRVQAEGQRRGEDRKDHNDGGFLGELKRGSPRAFREDSFDISVNTHLPPFFPHVLLGQVGLNSREGS